MIACGVGKSRSIRSGIGTSGVMPTIAGPGLRFAAGKPD